MLFDGNKLPCIELLPIQTRSSNSGVTEYKRFPEEWKVITLDIDEPDAMQDALSHVSETTRVLPEQAGKLGFEVGKGEVDLYRVGDDGMVEIPRWRHAVINFPHPLLKQGLVRPSQLEIFVMDADGSNVKQLTRHGVGSFAPYPTPDGRGVVYATNIGADAREFDIRYVGFDGREERITTAPSFDGFPMFSPDGKWLVFASNRANQAGARDTDLYIARWVP